MKTFYKILLLILFSVGAVAGVLVFAKTQVAPPMSIDLVNQYNDNLESDCSSYSGMNDHQKSRREYLRLDDKLKRFSRESVIDPETADRYRRQIDETYGKDLCQFGYRFFQRTDWPDKDIRELTEMLLALRADKLSSGESAVNEEFIADSDKLNSIVSRYREARQLAHNTSFSSIDNAWNKLRQADDYASEEYLKNNHSLVADLNSMRGKLARSHYNYVASQINRLGGYTAMSEDSFTSLLENVNRVINEYKGTNIYGNDKPSIADLETRKSNYVRNAASYYSNFD